MSAMEGLSPERVATSAVAHLKALRRNATRLLAAPKEKYTYSNKAPTQIDSPPSCGRLQRLAPSRLPRPVG